jgi:ATP-dependent Lon protease
MNVKNINAMKTQEVKKAKDKSRHQMTREINAQFKSASKQFNNVRNQLIQLYSAEMDVDGKTVRVLDTLEADTQAGLKQHINLLKETKKNPTVYKEVVSLTRHIDTKKFKNVTCMWWILQGCNKYASAVERVHNKQVKSKKSNKPAAEQVRKAA